ncbi:MAG TPA: NfeD family protein [Gammaproteobacteria bacterium]|nr:NfeD family protein [Gammaproteobacteria bacterium]
MDMNHWHWWILGLVFVILEVFAPGAIFIWMGAAAGVVGLLELVFDLDWKLQWGIFAVLSVASILAWRYYLKRHPTPTEQPVLNRRGEQYVGRTFTLEEPIVNGNGKIRVDDSTWKIEGEDCPVGTKVEVTGVDGVILKVRCTD